MLKGNIMYCMHKMIPKSKSNFLNIINLNFPFFTARFDGVALAWFITFTVGKSLWRESDLIATKAFISILKMNN